MATLKLRKNVTLKTLSKELVRDLEKDKDNARR